MSEPDLYKESYKYFRNATAVELSNRCSSNRNEKMKRKLQSKNNNNEVVPLQRCEESSVTLLEIADNNDGVLLKQPFSDSSGSDFLRTKDISRNLNADCNCHQMWGLKPPESWKVYEFTFPAGLIVIKNPFTSAGQRFWISRTLLDFPHHPDYITNMDNLNRLERIKTGESVETLKDFKLDTCARNYYQTLRWVTFGYHHDWDTKVYTDERRSNFPEDLADMTKYVSQILGFEDFEAEAAIANYYHMDSTLSGHVDRSEVNQTAPLFSISFGQSCIFLIGGKSKADRPQSILLQSGDIAVMSGESRLSYHGVPAILPASRHPWDEDEVLLNELFNDPKTLAKEDDTKQIKKPKLAENVKNHLASWSHCCESFKTSMKEPLVQQKMKRCPWTNFLKTYVNNSRINLNIRQVLFPGQKNLSENVNH